MSFMPINKQLLFGQDGDAYREHAPFIYIDWLAVRRARQGQQIGTLLLIAAIRKAVRVAEDVPIYGIALRSLNERTTAYYERLGFVVREQAGPHPIMILPIWAARELVGIPTGIT